MQADHLCDPLGPEKICKIRHALQRYQIITEFDTGSALRKTIKSHIGTFERIGSKSVTVLKEKSGIPHVFAETFF
jgi:hypothetical protein